MKQHHMPLRDRLISQTTLMGKAMAPVAGLANAALANKPIRALIEATIGIHRNAPMPKSSGQPFARWWKKRPTPTTPAPRGQLVFFHGCAGGYFEVETSKKTIEVLEHLGYRIIVPAQTCCGLAQQSNGLYPQAAQNTLKLAQQLHQAGPELTIISSSGSCTGMLKHEARNILGLTDPTLDSVSYRIRDIMEFLLDLHHQNQLPTNFQPIKQTATYHAPCQLRSQGMGQPALELLRLIPELTTIESTHPCCGIAGTYGLKKEKYDTAQKIGQPLFNLITHTNPNLAYCDTETCRWQLRQATHAQIEHPIWAIHQAYGLS
jgi:glycerol-3-phosphate dehydrogenase subunit C